MTRDAIPEAVVRCKDCKYSEKTQMSSSGPEVRVCYRFMVLRCVLDDDFCSSAERRE